MKEIEAARAAKEKYSAELLRRPGVCGIGVETDDAGVPVVTVHIDPQFPDAQEAIPSSLDGVPVRIVESGPFRKLGSRRERPGQR